MSMDPVSEKVARLFAEFEAEERARRRKADDDERRAMAATEDEPTN